MRVEIKLRPAEDDTLLPFNYNYDVYTQLLEKISIVSPELAREVEASQVDYFTFSRIMIRKREIVPERGIRVLSDDVSLYVSSHSPEVIKAISEGFIDSPTLRIEDATFIAEDVRVLREPKLKGNSLFSTLSPILVRTVRLVDGKMKVWDLYPDDPMFQDKLRKVMLLRYSTLYGEMPPNKDFRIEVIKFKPVRILVRNVYYRGSLMVFRYSGSEEIAKLGYENGFGEKTRYGFGMVKVIESERGREDQGKAQ
ncbi:CRISPR-associated endoribonuclease Cas6 [Thermococcus sp.]|uniref:CRISPR-associated endoribonuclease Cas6 n=1 Tax=Thermococcus sp. TaxID=35749 RepID=UPI0026308D01|nr:CRISPR-associated endoribonuclease Cas6 [Thermococcus sp.]